jgi:hypothetical protein
MGDAARRRLCYEAHVELCDEACVELQGDVRIPLPDAREGVLA